MNYQLLELIDGFPSVCKALCSDGTLVAIKNLRFASAQDFYREVSVMNQLVGNPHVVQLLDWDRSGLGQWFAMEFCEGGSLFFWMKRRHSPEEIARVLWGVLCGLAAIHQQGGVHCDIKPANIYLKDGEAKLGDFGASWIPDLGIRKTLASNVADRGYTAPELQQNSSREFEASADIYVAGRLLHETLGTSLSAGPWSGLSAQLLRLSNWMTNDDPTQRPTAEDCLRTLSTMKTRANDSSYTSFVRNLSSPYW
jgi:serine/threonine protein kinase